jgi:hypothetical protein
VEAAVEAAVVAAVVATVMATVMAMVMGTAAVATTATRVENQKRSRSYFLDALLAHVVLYEVKEVNVDALRTTLKR